MISAGAPREQRTFVIDIATYYSAQPGADESSPELSGASTSSYTS